jgi:hypothetical protein
MVTGCPFAMRADRASRTAAHVAMGRAIDWGERNFYWKWLRVLVADKRHD